MTTFAVEAADVALEQTSSSAWRCAAGCLRPLVLSGLLAISPCAPASAQDELAGPVDLRAALVLLDILMPAGAVVAFNREECPAGWSEYGPARGRFIRGIDPTGERYPDGVRELGSYQADAFQAHRHAIDPGGIPGIYDSTQGSGPDARAAAPSYEDRNSHLVLEPTDSPDGGRVRTGRETRPDNVALLYCERRGSD